MSVGVSDDQIARFRAALSHLGADEGRLCLAVSGGPDSMALLLLGHAVAADRMRVATMDHALRTGSADEAAMVGRHCASLGVSHTVLRPAAPIEGASAQAQARTARYAALAEWAGAAPVATAHHADDQAETFLMRAARGSGVAGLAGIRPATTIEGARVIRPLLGWRRAELRAIIRRIGAPFVDDPSNADPRHDRTKFRRLLETNEWLDAPMLAAAATQAGEADADLAAICDWLWRERASADGDTVTLEAADLPREMRRRLVRRGIASVRAAARIEAPAWSDSANVEPLLDALEGGRGASQAGVIVRMRRDTWRFAPAPARRGH